MKMISISNNLSSYQCINHNILGTSLTLFGMQVKNTTYTRSQLSIVNV